MRRTSVLTAVIIALLCLSFEARAQYQPNFWQNILTNGAITLTTGQISNTAAISKPITVRQGKGLAILPMLAGSGASTSPTWFFFDVTADGTNWTTTQPLSFSVNANGTTLQRGYNLFAYTALDNVRQIRLAQATNATAVTIGVTNIVVSYSNQ